MDRAMLRGFPKIELHNHLDGGLRVDTVIELADETGYPDLPTTDPVALADWFDQGDSGSLETYLEAFGHTIGVMQTSAAIERVAYEAGEDLAGDGVIYAELRFAPWLNTKRGLRREAVIEAALAGLQRANANTGVELRLIVDAMRNHDHSIEDARAAVRFVGQGVVGFDLAGPEAGFPPDDHVAACRLAAEYGLGLTIHAGEAAGPESIHRAVAVCGAQRVGHGIRIIDDVTTNQEGNASFGGVASLVLDRQIPLEVCPHSNMHTLGLAPEEHPVGLLYRSGFNITLNTDNRLMSRVSLTDEYAFAVEHHDFSIRDLRKVTENALSAAFVDHSTRQRLAAVVGDGYAN